jgi:hypothetical protein
LVAGVEARSKTSPLGIRERVIAKGALGSPRWMSPLTVPRKVALHRFPVIETTIVKRAEIRKKRSSSRMVCPNVTPDAYP